MYMYLAKASFFAYLLVKNLLKTWEKVHFLTEKKHDQFWSSFLFLPYPFLASKWLKSAVVLFLPCKSPKSRQKKKRGLRHVFPSFSIENKLFGMHQTSFFLLRHLS